MIGYFPITQCILVFAMAGVAALPVTRTEVGEPPAGNSWAGQTDLYVDASATDSVDGLSWCTAFRELSDALLVATTGTTVHVAEGVYRPDTVGLADSRAATFRLDPGVVWLGGYEGCGGSNSVRLPDRNLTVLSGDLLGDDVGGWDDSSRADNAYHVVFVSGVGQPAELDGFVVSAGHADGLPSTHSQGGGMFVLNGSPTVRFSTFRGNFANDNGGGFYLASESVTVSRCRFEDNHANHRGGGLFAGGNSGTITLTDNQFERNAAELGGGAFLVRHGPASENENNVFRNNTANNGGGLYVLDSDVELAGLFLLFNEAIDDPIVSAGGGLFVDGGTLTVTDGVIAGNVARAKGLFAEGGGVAGVGAILNLTNTLIVSNRSEGVFATGGGIYSDGCDVTLFNVLIAGNEADDDAGGVHLQALSTLDLANGTLALNRAGRHGGGIYVVGGSHAGVADSIIWGNVAGDVIDEAAQIHIAAGTSEVSTTCLEGWSGGSESGNIAADPRFVSGVGGCLYLAQAAAGQPVDSPCVDGGAATAASIGLEARTTRIDQVGDVGLVDMGFHQPVFNRTIPTGDWSRNGRLDHADFQGLQQCMSESAADGGCACRIFDFDVDGVVTLEDVGSFVGGLVGP